MSTALSAAALWLICGLIGELLIRDRPHLEGIAFGTITLGDGVSHLIDR